MSATAGVEGKFKRKGTVSVPRVVRLTVSVRPSLRCSFGVRLSAEQSFDSKTGNTHSLHLESVPDMSVASHAFRFI